VRHYTSQVEFEREEFREEIALKRTEIDLKRKEWKASRRFSSRITPVAIGVFAAVLGLFGNIVVAWLQGENAARVQQRQAQTSLVVEAVKTGDRTTALRNLQWFLTAGLLQDPDQRISRLLENEASPVLPSPSKKPRPPTGLQCKGTPAQKFVFVMPPRGAIVEARSDEGICSFVLNRSTLLGLSDARPHMR
jgi:hypothetical protein